MLDALPRRAVLGRLATVPFFGTAGGLVAIACYGKVLAESLDNLDQAA